MKRHIYLDGELVEKSDRFIEALRPGELPPKGVFETLRVYQGQTFGLDRHIHRLVVGVKASGILMPWRSADVVEWARDIASRQRVKNARLRLLIWREMGCVRSAVTATPYRPPSDAAYNAGYAVMTLKCRRPADPSLSKVKSLNYGLFTRAYTKAAGRGFDEVFLINQDDHMFEASHANMFIVRDGQLLTPSLNTGCLKGVTRQYVMDIAGTLGVNVKTVKMKVPAVCRAEEVFITNSMLEVMPVTRVNETVIGSGEPGKVSRILLNRYRQRVAKEIR